MKSIFLVLSYLITISISTTSINLNNHDSSPSLNYNQRRGHIPSKKLTNSNKLSRSYPQSSSYNPTPLTLQLASQYSLNHIVSFPEPSKVLNSAETLTFLKSNYELYNNRITGGNISACNYIEDPLVSTAIAATQPSVLSVNYPSGSYSGNAIGGLQYFSEVLNGTETVLLNYEVGFEKDFNFVKGGKLPGLFGGNDTQECSGGRDSLNCFSARLMFRTGGAGEVYAYVPIYPGFCNQTSVLCNSEYGTSLSRGSFSFTPGTWTNITMLISLNTPKVANGVLLLYANGVLAMNYTNIVWRNDPSVVFTAMMFSTFFGGSDSSWASTGATSYFRGFDLYGSNSSSNTTGSEVVASQQPGVAQPTTSAKPTSSALSATNLTASFSILLISIVFAFLY